MVISYNHSFIILFYALINLFLTPDAKMTGCYKFDVSVCLSVRVSVRGIVAPKQMNRFGFCFFSLKIIIVGSVLNKIRWPPT